MSTSSLRLRVSLENFLGLEKGDIVKIGNITLVYSEELGGEHAPWLAHLDVYIEYQKPDFGIYVKDIKYLGRDQEYGDYLFNVTLELKNAGMTVRYIFNEFGQREALSFNFIPLYPLLPLTDIDVSLQIASSHRRPAELFILKRLNESYCLVAIPPDDVHEMFGGGFKDVWEEPQHEYICSYASSGDIIWLKIGVDEYYVKTNAVTFITPWGQKYEIEVSRKEVSST